MALKVVYSSKTEALTRELIQELGRRSGDNGVFRSDTIVVQGKGMERYLSQSIAEVNGVCMNIDFPFPQKVLREIVHALLSHNKLSNLKVPSNEEVAWYLFTNMDTFLEEKAIGSLMGAVRSYLKDDDSRLKQYQFCSRLANLFDQYSAYRPEMIANWISGKWEPIDADLIWQYHLWRKVFVERGEMDTIDAGLHWISLAQAFVQFRKKGFALSTIKQFPYRHLLFFGISTLPTLYRNLLEYVGEGLDALDIDLYLLYPASIPSLNDGRSRRSEVRDELYRRIEHYQLKDEISLRGATQNRSGEYFTTGNDLIMDMGVQADVFLNNLVEKWSPYYLSQDEIDSQSLLIQVQSQMTEFEQTEVETLDYCDSISFHDCFSPIREVEAAREFIQNCLYENPDLLPSDVIIMVSSMEKYAPSLRAVFSGNDPLYIPHTVADQSVRNENPYAEAILSIFELRNGRFTAEDILSLLDKPVIQEQLSFQDEDLLQVRELIRHSQFRWGINADHCSRYFDDTELSVYSWEASKKRILLGTVMEVSENNPSLYQEILPFKTEGVQSELALRFVGFMDLLTDLISKIDWAKNVADYTEVLEQMRSELLPSVNLDADQFKLVNTVINQLRQLSSDCNIDVSDAVFLEYLKNAFSETHVGRGFLDGKVTICEMRPMRSIPAKIVCLLGMNDEDYPRKENQLSFDFIARYRKPEDRSQNKEDRNLFMEALLSAREKLFISWTGRSNRDNSERPASSLVQDFCDYLNRYFKFSHSELEVSDLLTVKHRLHAFDPEYFDPDSKLPRAFTKQNYRIAQALNGDKIKQEKTAPVLPSSSIEEIDLEDLVQFFQNPSLYFLRSRLNAWRINPEDIEVGSEMILMNSLQQYNLKQEYLDKSDHEILDKKVYVQKGLIPAGFEGEIVSNQTKNEIALFTDKCKESWGEAEPSEHLIEVDLSNGIKIKGVAEIRGDLNTSWRMGSVKDKSKDWLRFWIKHLLVSAKRDDISGSISVYHDVLLKSNLLNPKVALLEIEKIVDLYLKGLQSPLCFFSESSFTFAKTYLTLLNKWDEQEARNKALDSALMKWTNNYKDYKSAYENEMDTYPYPDFFDQETVLEDSSFIENAMVLYEPIFTNVVCDDF